MSNAAPRSDGWTLRCPFCHEPAGTITIDERSSSEALVCPHCEGRTKRRGGVLDAIPSDLHDTVSRFLVEYGAVRSDEGRGSDDPLWYRDLPSVSGDDPLAWQWGVRAKSWRCLERRLIERLPPGRGLDLGAGVGWLSARLAVRGWSMLAIDLTEDPHDGLGAARHYDESDRPLFSRLLAHFDSVPLSDAQSDLIIFNASFHYSSDYRKTLVEAMRLLTPGGHIIIMDTPSYRLAASGAAMVRSRRAEFQERFGFASDALGSRDFLVEGELESLGHELGLTWRRLRPPYGLGWWLRPLKYRLQRRGREPAQFALWVGRRDSEHML